MKAILQKVPSFDDSSFAYQLFRLPHFVVPWHFHPELELVLILSSEGKRFIGDSIHNFSAGDLVLLGSNVPHWYRNDSVYYESKPGLEASSIVVQFSSDFLGTDFLARPECVHLRKLFQKAQMGVQIHGSTRSKIADMMLELQGMTGMNKLIHFLTILNTIISSGEYTTISSQPFVGSHAHDSERINIIYEHVMKNFKKNISIDEVAEKVHMCPATFCRFFKKRTRKTFTYFLNELRIGHACKLMIEKDLSMAEVCYASGYNNISYFNRQFKAIKNTTPQSYKHQYREV